MVKKWAIYMDRTTGQFYVRNTVENGFPDDPFRYLYVESSDSKDEIKDWLIKCVTLGYDGFSKYKIEKAIESEKDPKIKSVLKNMLGQMK